ncbi:erythromycin esterase family protein [Micromonospora sp. NPDC000207]|uniref:erythromycin esterase family protein n=1 Tax=Micromonospora sp. NPDC000207 TaxID=3154246 RepID=UPI0033264D62
MLVRRLGAPSDFDPLLERVRDARVVMVGEASHGSHDYYRIREQLTRRLIAEGGFSFVAVEGDWPDCDRVNRSVLGMPGSAADPHAALRRFERWPTWMWANAEVARFARWLRAWNLDRPETVRVGFHGLDVYSLWESMQAILDYVGEEDPDSFEAVQEAYACFEPYGRRLDEYGVASRFVSARCEEEVIRLLARTREHAASDGPDRFSAWQNAAVVAGAERYYRAMVGGGAQSWNVRDVHMADTLDRLLDRYGPQARGIVWAHNTHVGDGRATDMSDDGMVTIGQLARERYGPDDVVLIGFGSYRGTVTAAPRWGATVETMVVPPARPGSVEQRMHELLPERAVLVFDGPDQPGWVTETVDHRAIGVVYDPAFESWGNYVPTRLAQRYDGFVWCDETTALRPLAAVPTPGERETWPAGV